MFGIYGKSITFFSEEREDAAVFQIDGLTIDGGYNINSYKSPISLSKGTKLFFLGYPSHKFGNNSPEEVLNQFITCAIVNGDRRNLGCGDATREDTIEFYTKGNLSSEGLSGSPVFEDKSNMLIGIVKGFGDDTKDKRISEALGVKQFNVVRPLDKTIERIDSLR